MKLLSIVLCAVLFAAGCSSPDRRPVTEQIPLDEMNRLLKLKPDFGAVILLAERFRSQASTPDLARANDLTYAQLYKFYKSFTNEDLRNRLLIQGEQEWLEKFGPTYDRADTTIAYWQRYFDENVPDSYVSVELRSVLAEESTYGSSQVMLRVTPLKGSIDTLKGCFGIFTRNRDHSFGDFSPARNNTFSFEKGLRTAETCQAGMNYSIWDITDGDIPYNMYPDNPGLPIPELLEKYCFDFTVTKLVVKGKPIRFVDILETVPASVRSYWGEQDKELNEEYRRGEVVRELIDPAFEDRTDYVRDYQTAYFRKQDPLAAWIMLDKL